MPTRSGFHITIGTFPNTTSLENELNMVKAALLYGDKATLCSVGSTLMLSILALSTLNSAQQLDFLLSVMPALGEDATAVGQVAEAISVLKSLKGKKHRTPQEIILMNQFESRLMKAWQPLALKATEMAKESGVFELVELVDAGLLEIQFIDTTGDIGRTYTEMLQKAINDHLTYPLFDDGTGGLVRAAIREGAIPVSKASAVKAKSVQLATELFERLPLFESATIDELLDIKRELAAPLTRFRAAMLKFSDKIEAAAWDDEFSTEAEVVFRREIEPAVLDIEGALSSNPYLEVFARKLIDKPLAVAGGSALGIVMSQLGAVSSIVAQGLGIGIPVGLTAYDAYKEWTAKRLYAEQNQLYFYYRASTALAPRR